MDLTPQAVSDAEFREAKRGGYNIRDVDDFLDQVAVGVGQLHERIRDAYQRAERAEAQVAELQSHLEAARSQAPPAMAAPDGAAAAGGDTDETLRRTLMVAQRTADATVEEARNEAARIVEEARAEAAQARASVQDAALGDVAVARDRAHQDVAELEGRKAQLEAEIAALDDQVRVKKESVRAELEDLQRLLDSSGGQAGHGSVPAPSPVADRGPDPAPPVSPFAQPVAEAAPPDPPPLVARASGGGDDSASSFQPPPAPMFPVPGPDEGPFGRNGQLPGGPDHLPGPPADLPLAEPDEFVPGTRLSSDAVAAPFDDEPQAPVAPPPPVEPEVPSVFQPPAEPQEPALAPFQPQPRPQGDARPPVEPQPQPQAPLEPRFPAFEPQGSVDGGAPPQAAPGAAQEEVDLQGGGPVPAPAVPPMPPIPPPPEPGPLEPGPLEPAPHRAAAPEIDRVADPDPFGAEPERPPLPSREPGNQLPSREPMGLRDGAGGGNVADLQELPGGPAGGPPPGGPPPGGPQPPGGPVPAPGLPGGPGGGDDRPFFASPPSPGQTGFLPDLPPSPVQQQGSEPPANGGLPIDAPPPPPPPPGLEQLRDVGALPDGEQRPSGWGRDGESDEAEGSGIRFGRP